MNPDRRAALKSAVLVAAFFIAAKLLRAVRPIRKA
jgi:hypothetical protein